MVRHLLVRAHLTTVLAFTIVAASCGDDTNVVVEVDNTPVRFIAMGDVGTGSEEQYAVGRVIRKVCDLQGCDFALLLGDNFYQEGVSGVDDPQWDEKFEDVYAVAAGLTFPFYPVLGNHDGGGKFGVELDPGDIQVAYTTSGNSAIWNMPDRYYLHSHGNADFFALDTSTMLLDGINEEFEGWISQQTEWMQTTLAERPATNWRFAYGHHPYLSNGEHGNAGCYEDLCLIGVDLGIRVKRFVDLSLCGKVDFFLSGHEHNRQWHITTCEGTQFIVSGGGAKTTEFETDDNAKQPVHYQDDSIPGFIWFEIIGNSMKVEFWDMDAINQVPTATQEEWLAEPLGEPAYTHTIKKNL